MSVPSGSQNNQGAHWYALYTRSRHECRVDCQLRQKGIESYLPMRKVLRRWSDRKKWVDDPLFRCYVFIHADPRERYNAVQAYGAVRIVSFRGKLAIVRDDEIERIKRILYEAPAAEAGPMVELGDIVEIVRGALTGIMGRIENLQGRSRLVVSIPSVHQTLRFNIDRSDVKIVKRQ